jgi:outer membrane protein TolC
MKHTLQFAGAFLMLTVICAWGQPVTPMLSLDEAITIALQRHGNVEAAEAAVDAYQGALKQAGYSQNPTLHLQTENWRFRGTPGFSASGDLELFAFGCQPLVTGGK